jgi:hypothetical protein
MTGQEFCAKIFGRYPDLRNKTSEMTEIEDLLNGLGEGSIRQLWEEFRDTYDQARSPVRATFVKMRDKLGLPRLNRGQVLPAEPEFEMLCDLCGRRYGLNGLKCPGCGEPHWNRNCRVIRRGSTPRSVVAAPVIEKDPRTPEVLALILQLAQKKKVST